MTDLCVPCTEYSGAEQGIPGGVTSVLSRGIESLYSTCWPQISICKTFVTMIPVNIKDKTGGEFKDQVQVARLTSGLYE